MKSVTGENLSPSRLAFRKLTGNPGAVAGLLFITLNIFTALFCYTFMPDGSPNANVMSLPLSLQPPGTRVDLLSIPLAKVEKVSWLTRMVSGAPVSHSFIPVDTFYVHHSRIQYREFSSDPDCPGDTGSLPLEVLGSGGEGLAGETTIADQYIRRHCLTQRTFWLGTDRFGRDVLSRLMLASRVSLSVGLIAVVISLTIGITLGALAGFYRGWVDRLVMWLVNVVWSIPTLLLVVAITMALGKGFMQVFIAVGLTMWVEVARMVRGQFFSLREQQFVEAGRALGFSNARIIVRHILPNVIGPVIVMAAGNFASAILLEAGLSFLGMGVQPPVPSWGMMIKENYALIVADAAWLAIIPGMAIAMMVLAFTLLGNGLRDAFDVRE